MPSKKQRAKKKNAKVTEQKNNNMFVSCEKSKIAGFGIFAKKTIPKNTVITKYCSNVNLVKIQEVPADCMDYVMSSPNNNELVVYGNPNDKVDLRYCGHMINDKFSLIFEKGSSLQENEVKINKYSNLPEQTITFYDKSYNMMTNVDVKEKEELTIKYGVNYWLSWNIRNSKDIYLRFMAFYLKKKLGFINIRNNQYEEALQECGIRKSGPFMEHLGLINCSSLEQWTKLEEYVVSGRR